MILLLSETGWRSAVEPAHHAISAMAFDFIFGADGKNSGVEKQVVNGKEVELVKGQ